MDWHDGDKDSKYAAVLSRSVFYLRYCLQNGCRREVEKTRCAAGPSCQIKLPPVVAPAQTMHLLSTPPSPRAPQKGSRLTQTFTQIHDAVWNIRFLSSTMSIDAELTHQSLPGASRCLPNTCLHLLSVRPPMHHRERAAGPPYSSLT